MRTMSIPKRLIPILTTIALFLMASPALAEEAAPTAITVNSVSVETGVFGHLLLFQILLLVSVLLLLWNSQWRREHLKVRVRNTKKLPPQPPVNDPFDTPQY